MVKALFRSVMALAIFVALLCVLYPLAVYAVGHLLFRDQVEGGIVLLNGKPVGARLIGQSFTKPEYFHGRPSAAGSGYDAANSGGSNLGPTSQKLFDAVSANVATVLKENPTLKPGEVPTQLVTASASGLDPHISPEAAQVQVSRVASARHASVDAVAAVLREHVEGPQWGVFGDPVVNVLALNLALDEKLPLKK